MLAHKKTRRIWRLPIEDATVIRATQDLRMRADAIEQPQAAAEAVKLRVTETDPP
jgi:hypothetical protein